MRGQRGKKAKYVVYAEQGLIENNKWQHELKSFPIELICQIRRELRKNIPGLNEKFNRGSRYFGYWTGQDGDRVYIYVRKKDLRIDLFISRKYEKDIQNQGYFVKHLHNYQGRADWLTGWHVPHSTKKLKQIVEWLCKAFEENL